MSKKMRIGELAALANITPRTVRHYEALGLLPHGEREAGGQHRYSEEAIARLRRIERLKLLGLSLDEINRVLPLYFSDPSGRKAKMRVLEMLRTHLVQAESQLEELNSLRSELVGRIQHFERWLSDDADQA